MFSFPIYLFTWIAVTIYSTMELSDSLIVLGKALKSGATINVALSIEIKVPRVVNFDQEAEK